MEDKMMALSVSLVAFGLLVTAFSASQTDDISCSEAVNDLLPCEPFMVGSGNAPSPACCNGAATVAQKATTTEIRRNLCDCFKKAAAQIPIKLERVKQLPQLCKVALSFPIDPQANCSSIP